MKLIAKINERQFEIRIKREEEKVFAEIDGRSYHLEASEPEPNVFLLKHEGHIFEVFISPNESKIDPFKVMVKNNEFEVKLLDPKKLRGTISDGGNADEIGEIKTAMPGKVVRILLTANSEVKSGEGVIIVEAMKMQNELKSPKDGLVKEIKFSEGDTVNAGDVLVIIE